jgi:hypothetical protein
MSNFQACHEHVRNLNLITKCKCAILKDHEAEMEKKSRGTPYLKRRDERKSDGKSRLCTSLS